MLKPDEPALVLAPMEGITDAPMRALQGSIGAFTFGVSAFLRVSVEVLPKKAFLREVPEIAQGGLTMTGLPVAVQILGGDPERMAESAWNACEAGATAIDLNFGCPAKVVNRHDGGASLLRSPKRIRGLVEAVRAAVPREIPVSAKLRLGWDSMDSIDENAAMAAEGGASWLTIHGRTKMQGYQPPAYWGPIGRIRRNLALPVVANGDIWTLADFRQCAEETGCRHFMLGRGAMANPFLSHAIARELGLPHRDVGAEIDWAEIDWVGLCTQLMELSGELGYGSRKGILLKLKQWLCLAGRFGEFRGFDEVKRAETLEEFFSGLELVTRVLEPLSK